MKQTNYLLPNFINVIYKKVESHLQDGDISRERFNQYCLAVMLFHVRNWSSKIVGLSFPDKEKQTLERLCLTSGFTPYQEEGKGDQLLEGLPPDAFSYSEVIGKIQLLVNRFSQYEVLKDYSEQSAVKSEYETICDKLEVLRKEFRLKVRLKYNKFKRRDNPFFKGGVVVIIPDNVECGPSNETDLSSGSGDADSAEDSTQPKEED